MTFKLLTAFKQLFNGKKYIHRSSNLGDWVSIHLYEDLYDYARTGKSQKLVQRIESDNRIISTSNKRVGIKSRRGDGSFGEIVPGTSAIRDQGYSVARGSLATVEIGSEVKIAAKAMIKQSDRVVGDLRKQVDEFRKKGPHCICVGIVGVNHAKYAVGYESDRAYRTDGKKHKHPFAEAPKLIQKLLADAAPAFDEFLILGYSATNDDPYPFAWVNRDQTEKEYGAALVRLCNLYDSRF